MLSSIKKIVLDQRNNSCVLIDTTDKEYKFDSLLWLYVDFQTGLEVEWLLSSVCVWERDVTNDVVIEGMNGLFDPVKERYVYRCNGRPPRNPTIFDPFKQSAIF